MGLLIGITSFGQSGPENNSKEGMFYMAQISTTEAFASDAV